MPRPRPRSFRPVSDDLWHEAVAKAYARGTTVSAVLNAALLDFVESDETARGRDAQGAPVEGGQSREDD